MVSEILKTTAINVSSLFLFLLVRFRTLISPNKCFQKNIFSNLYSDWLGLKVNLTSMVEQHSVQLSQVTILALLKIAKNGFSSQAL